MPHLIQIKSGKNNVLLPNGALLAAGQQSVLTDEEFASIDQTERDDILTDLGDPTPSSSGQIAVALVWDPANPHDLPVETSAKWQAVDNTAFPAWFRASPESLTNNTGLGGTVEIDQGMYLVLLDVEPVYDTAPTTGSIEVQVGYPDFNWNSFYISAAQLAEVGSWGDVFVGPQGASFFQQKQDGWGDFGVRVITNNSGITQIGWLGLTLIKVA